jgi:hypothetical protein
MQAVRLMLVGAASRASIIARRAVPTSLDGVVATTVGENSRAATTRGEHRR